MALAALTQTILTFAAIVVVGVVLRTAGVVRRTDAHALNQVIIYVGLPAFIFDAVHGASISADFALVVLVSWVVFAALLAGGLGVAHVTRANAPRRGAIILVTALGNTGYLGYPVTAAVLGSSAVPAAVFSDVFGTVFALVLVCLPLVARWGARSATGPHPLRELLAFPAVGALLLAMVLRFVPIPNPVSSGLDALASMVAPLIMLSVGISMRPRSIAENLGQLGAVAVVKLLAAPALAAGLVALMPGAREVEAVAVLQAGMPAMMLSVAMAERFGLDDDFAAAAVFVTTVSAALTIPLTQWVLG